MSQKGVTECIFASYVSKQHFGDRITNPKGCLTLTFAFLIYVSKILYSTCVLPNVTLVFQPAIDSAHFLNFFIAHVWFILQCCLKLYPFLLDGKDKYNSCSKMHIIYLDNREKLQDTENSSISLRKDRVNRESGVGDVSICLQMF